MRAGRRDVPLTHPDKVLFPDDGITKADLAAYYRDAAPRMVDLVPASPDDFPLVCRTARDLGDVLREAGVEPFAMTTGSKGIHVVVALQRRYGFGQVRDAAVAVAAELVERRPDDLTTEFYKRK